MNYRHTKTYPAFRVGYDPVPDWAQSEIENGLLFLNYKDDGGWMEQWAIYAEDGQWVVDARSSDDPADALLALYTDEQFRGFFEPVLSVQSAAIEANVLTDRQKAACDAVARLLRPTEGCACMAGSPYPERMECLCEKVALAALAAADAATKETDLAAKIADCANMMLSKIPDDVQEYVNNREYGLALEALAAHVMEIK